MTLNKYKKEGFSLILSGGGALGFAHLGVIHDLEKKQLVPDEIAGTSMGGIVAACRAVGLKSKEIYSVFKEFNSVSKWMSFSFGGHSIVKSSKLEKIFSNIFGDTKIQDTQIKLKIIATSLRDGVSAVLDGNVKIKDALLATMAIPGIFEEKTIGQTVYADGFLAENLPLLRAECQNIIAVDVLGKNSFTGVSPENKTGGMFEMFDKSVRLLIYNQTQCNISKCTKNIYLIEPVTKNYKTYHFNKLDEIMNLGKLDSGVFV
jgi:NTE family protein